MSRFVSVEAGLRKKMRHKCFLQQKVTKGARHKIVISIQKLKERQNLLRSLEKVSVSYNSSISLKAQYFPHFQHLIYSSWAHMETKT